MSTLWKFLAYLKTWQIPGNIPLQASGTDWWCRVPFFSVR